MPYQGDSMEILLHSAVTSSAFLEANELGYVFSLLFVCKLELLLPYRIKFKTTCIDMTQLFTGNNNMKEHTVTITDNKTARFCGQINFPT